jgi:hypothetical protein
MIISFLVATDLSKEVICANLFCFDLGVSRLLYVYEENTTFAKIATFAVVVFCFAAVGYLVWFRRKGKPFIWIPRRHRGTAPYPEVYEFLPKDDEPDERGERRSKAGNEHKNLKSRREMKQR